MGYQLPPLPRPLGETHIWYRYDKKFAYLPVKTTEKKWAWLCTYYEKYMVFSYKEINDISYFKCRLSEANAIIDKLTEGNLTF